MPSPSPFDETQPHQPSKPDSGMPTDENRIIDGDDLDDLLTACLESYEVASPIRAIADLRALLPMANEATQRFLLIELIKQDMSARDSSHPIEAYVDAMSDLLTIDQVPVDLVLEEIQLRKDAGHSLELSEYERRFPKFANVIAPILSGSVEATAAVKNSGAPPELEVGSQIDDFLIIQTLGSGAFANVYLARQISMHRLVALKVSRGTGDEPQALSQLDHPNIVRVYDQRELDSPDVHLLYMQFLSGGTLSDVVKFARGIQMRLRDGGVLVESVDRQLLKSAQAAPERSSVRKWLRQADWPAVVAWLGIGLARALDEAHRRGVLHRDVKPANVLLSADCLPKLADFNVSFAGDAGRAGAGSSFGGSIGYMSPEHLRAISAVLGGQEEEVAEQADLYALGILLWELWQGHRPFDGETQPDSWSEAVAQQLSARQSALPKPEYFGGASERVLESTLGYVLSYESTDRPTSGAELAARLQLALHPDVADLFQIAPNSVRSRILGWSPWIVPSLVLLVPNLFAMVFNFFYNRDALVEKHKDDLPGLNEFFMPLAGVVSLVCLSIGVYFVVALTKEFVRAMGQAQANEKADDRSVTSVILLGQHAALIGGSLWAVAGLIYPIALSWRFPELPLGESIRFFFSLVICGGIAAIYPYFGMTTLGTLVYYPRLIRNSMQDANFDKRVRRLTTQCERFWLAAVAIPLLGAALLVFSDQTEKLVVLCAVAATAVGAFLAMRAYATIQRRWKQMGTVLSERGTAVPGLGLDD